MRFQDFKISIAVLSIASVFISIIYSNVCSQARADEKIPSLTKQQIKARLSSNPRWVAYLIVKTNDFSLLSSINDYLDRKEASVIAQFLSVIKKIANGDTKDLPDKYADWLKLVLAVKNRDSSGLTGYKLRLYQGFVNNDSASIMNAFDDPNYPDSFEDTKSIAELVLNIYNGFKGNFKVYSSDTPLLTKFSVDVLFLNANPDSLLDQVASDISYCLLSKQSKSNQFCNLISNPFIKKLCTDPTIITFNQLYENIWR